MNLLFVCAVLHLYCIVELRNAFILELSELKRIILCAIEKTELICERSQ